MAKTPYFDLLGGGDSSILSETIQKEIQREKDGDVIYIQWSVDDVEKICTFLFRNKTISRTPTLDERREILRMAMEELYTPIVGMNAALITNAAIDFFIKETDIK